MCATIKTPEILKSPETRTDDRTEPLVPVVVHFTCEPFYADAMRVWRTTYLLDLDSAHRSELIDKKNITYAPNWTFVQYGASHRFTLYFAPLPKRVIQFDLREIIPQPGGWHIQGIRRNREDVYQVRLPN